MLKILKIFIFFLSPIFANFITDAEYAKMLYENPRGISCAKCHGEFGEGKVIAKYKEFNKQTGKKEIIEFKAPNINSMDLQEFARKIRDPNGVMPNYFLNNDEIITLYNYLKRVKNEK